MKERRAIKSEEDFDSIKPFFAIAGLLLGTTLLAAFILSSNSASADPASSSASTTASVKISAACTLTRTGRGNYTVTIANGSSDEINGSTISSICNDPNGYSLYAIGFSNDSITNNNDKLISSVSNDYNISTGTNTSGGTSNWAMKVNPTTGNNPTITNSFNNYHNIPTTYMQVATYDSVTTTPSSAGASVDTKYQVYISGSQPAGSYTGKVKYTLVHPNNAPKPVGPVNTNPGYISYNPNATGVVDSMNDQSISTTDTSAMLWASNFQRPGYGFAGWSDKFDWTLNANDEDGNGTGVNTGYHIYGPNETITFTAGQYSGQNPGLSLYAVWVESDGTIQDWDGCSNMDIGDVTALTDQRDDQTYAVARLKDGNCWMIENLRLDSQYTVGYNIHDPSVTNQSLAQGYNSGFVGLAEPETDTFTQYSSSNSIYYYGEQSGTATINIGVNNGMYRMPKYNNSNTSDSVSSLTVRSTYDNTHHNYYPNTYSMGNNYTFAAAIADYRNYNSSQIINGTSICPKGWKMPTGGEKSAISNDYYSLSVAVTGFAPESHNYLITELNSKEKTASACFRSYPNNFILTGVYEDRWGHEYRGWEGSYWSSTVSNQYYAYIFELNDDKGSVSVNPGSSSGYKIKGYSIRCIINN